MKGDDPMGRKFGVARGAAFALTGAAGAQWTVINLHPAGASHSWAYGVRDGQQVGEVTVGATSHASLWSGTAASWVDLHTFLPPAFVVSLARGIWHDGAGTTHVVGYGMTTSGIHRALMWVVPAPGSLLTLGAGLAVLVRRRR